MCSTLSSALPRSSAAPLRGRPTFTPQSRPLKFQPRRRCRDGGRADADVLNLRLRLLSSPPAHSADPSSSPLSRRCAAVSNAAQWPRRRRSPGCTAARSALRRWRWRAGCASASRARSSRRRRRVRSGASSGLPSTCCTACCRRRPRCSARRRSRPSSPLARRRGTRRWRTTCRRTTASVPLSNIVRPWGPGAPFFVLRKQRAGWRASAGSRRRSSARGAGGAVGPARAALRHGGVDAHVRRLGAASNSCWSYIVTTPSRGSCRPPSARGRSARLRRQYFDASGWPSRLAVRDLSVRCVYIACCFSMFSGIGARAVRWWPFGRARPA